MKVGLPYPKIEEEVLDQWKKEKSFEESVDSRELEKDGKSNAFVFYDGPPFANGLPHHGHVLTGFIKDTFARYQTMLGKKVERKFGWDCHGLPAEMEVEKTLGVSGRKAIINHGIDKFNEECRSSVMKYADEWEYYVTRQARWVDFKDSYKTMDLQYMESVIWSFKELFKKGLLYEDHRVMPYSWKCETPLSNFETKLDNSYRQKESKAVTVKFKIIDKENTYLLAWSTTPWTLPSNLILAVGADIEYSVFSNQKESFILATAAIGKYEKELTGYEKIDTILGKELVGLPYKPLFPYFEKHANAFRVLAGDFVTTEDGTGIVHIAPGFGEDDHILCKQSSIATVCPVDDAGKFTSEIYDINYKLAEKDALISLQGKVVIECDDEVIKYLKGNNNWLKTEQYFHNYPHCWRTDTPLIYKAINSWYVKVTDIKDRMVELNQDINWIPEHVKDGIFGKWLENARDWSISRNRFWGCPIPVWKSEKKNFVNLSSFAKIIKDIVDNNHTSLSSLLKGGKYSYLSFKERLGEVSFYNSYNADNLDKAKELRQNMTDAEKKVWYLVKDNFKNYNFRRQVPVGNYIVDFLSQKLKLIFEIDGDQHASNIDYDSKRTEYLHVLGYKVVRLWNNDITDNCYDIIDHHIKERQQELYAFDIVEHLFDGYAIEYNGQCINGAKNNIDSFRDLLKIKLDYETVEIQKLYIFGSIAELEEFFETQVTDLHRPYIDQLIKPDPIDPEYTIKRVDDVLDCWFESGAMPFASVHYPFNNKDYFEKNFPADFIVEYMAQTRGWFYTLMILGTALFDKAPFKNCICHGVIVDENGQKLSKRLRNYIDLKEVFDKFGSDALRWFMLRSPVMRGNEIKIDKEGEGIAEVSRTVLNMIYNALTFFTIYTKADNISAKESFDSKNIMDIYILSKLQELTSDVKNYMDQYDTVYVCHKVEVFLDILNNWYIRRNKKRFWESEYSENKQDAYNTLYTVLKNFSLITSPLLPCLSEKIWNDIEVLG